VAIVRELARGRAVGFLIDLPGRVAQTPAKLFGQEAPLALGPARIALARGAAVLVGAPAPRCGGAAIRLTRIPTQDLAPGPEGERALVSRLAGELERRIQAWPAAWLGVFATPKFDTRFCVSLDCSMPARRRCFASTSPRAPEPPP
jgi:lauroyl/myristoyl acyltransferase